MKNKLEQLEALVAALKEDVVKFEEKGNASAGTRLRKTLQGIKSLAQELRVDIQEKKKNDKQAK